MFLFRGINIYKKGDKLNPNVSFPWSEVTTVKPSKKDLKIKLQAPNNQKTPPFISEAHSMPIKPGG